jgi:membrane protein YdbS with pleckstrin-like domain
LKLSAKLSPKFLPNHQVINHLSISVLLLGSSVVFIIELYISDNHNAFIISFLSVSFKLIQALIFLVAIFSFFSHSLVAFSFKIVFNCSIVAHLGTSLLIAFT